MMAWAPGGKPSMSSQDYEANESEVVRVYQTARYPHQHSDARFRDAGDHHDDGSHDHKEENDDARAQKALQWQTRKRSFLRWLIILLMAVIIETIYLFISFSSANLLKHKANFMLHAPTPGAKYAIKLFFSLLYAAVAFGMVYLVPTSAGSGIPETKAFLNGIRIPNMQRYVCCAWVLSSFSPPPAHTPPFPFVGSPQPVSTLPSPSFPCPFHLPSLFLHPPLLCPPF